MDEAEQFEKDYNMWTLKEDPEIINKNKELKEKLKQNLPGDKICDDNFVLKVKEYHKNKKEHNKFVSVSDIKKAMENEGITKDQIRQQMHFVFCDVKNVVFQNIDFEFLMRAKEQTDAVIKYIINNLKEIPVEEQENTAQELNIKINKISELFYDKIHGISISNLKNNKGSV